MGRKGWGFMADDTKQIDASNDSYIGVRAGNIVPMMPIGEMTPAKALRLAAWIVALADHSEDHADFKAVLAAVTNT